MKESRYNISMEYKGQQLLFNSRTIATAALDEAALEILDAIRKGEQVENSNLALEMKRVGFLVDDAIDELQQLEMNYNLSKYQKLGVGLVIAPTMACNFSCPYCFEGVQKGVMSEELQNKIASLVAYYAKEGQDITITWFGGEPLLSKEDIYRMSEKMISICDKEHVNYTAGIITNGYLLDEECILKLKEFKVEFVQITLDGLPETHNKKRKLKSNSHEPTFDCIVNNIILAKNKGLRIAVRVNVDKETQSELEPLLELMVEKGIGQELHLGHVCADTDSSKGFCSKCLDNKEFAQVAVNFERLLFAKKISTNYPVPVRTKCGADYLYSFVIDADGDIYKCWNDIGIKETRIGNISEIECFEQLAQIPNQNYTKYMTWSPFSFEKCRACKILPICQGGCLYNGIEGGKPVCDNWKYELEEYIKLKYDAADWTQ